MNQHEKIIDHSQEPEIHSERLTITKKIILSAGFIAMVISLALTAMSVTSTGPLHQNRKAEFLKQSATISTSLQKGYSLLLETENFINDQNNELGVPQNALLVAEKSKKMADMIDISLSRLSSAAEMISHDALRRDLIDVLKNAKAAPIKWTTTVSTRFTMARTAYQNNVDDVKQSKQWIKEQKRASQYIADLKMATVKLREIEGAL